MSLRDLFVARLPSRRGSGGTPGPCSGLEVLKSTPTSIKVTWLAPERCEPLVDRYHVQYTPKYLGVWLDANGEGVDAQPSITEPRCVIDGLDPASRYMVRVRAGNAVGWGPFNVFPGEIWTRTVDGVLCAPLPQFERIQIRKPPSADELKVEIPEGRGLGGRKSSEDSIGSATHAKPPSHPPGHGKFRAQASSGAEASFMSSPVQPSAVNSPGSSCNLCGASLLRPGKCRSKNSRTREQCGCTLYQQHLVPEMRPLCGRCEHKLSCHQTVVSWSCAKCSNVVCQACRRIVHESVDSEPMPVASIDGLPSPLSASGSTGSTGKSCCNPRHVHLSHDAFTALKASLSDKRPLVTSSSNPQLDALVSAGRSDSVNSLDSDITVAALSTAPAIPGDLGADAVHSRQSSRLLESIDPELTSEPYYVTLGCPLDPSTVRYLWETLRRSDGAVFSDLAQTSEPDHDEPPFLTSDQLTPMTSFAVCSLPFAIVTQDALFPAPPPLPPMPVASERVPRQSSGHRHSDFSDIMAAESVRIGIETSPVLLPRRPLSIGLGVSLEEYDNSSLPPPSPCIPTENMGDSASESSPPRPQYDFFTLCSSCARDLGTRSGVTSESVSEFASPTAEPGIRRASSLHVAARLSFSELRPPLPAFRVRSASDSNFAVKSPSALMSPVLSLRELSPTLSGTSSRQQSDVGRPRSVDRVTSLLRMFELGDARSSEDHDTESLLDDHCEVLPPRGPVRSTVSSETFTPRAVHAEMDPVSVASVIALQLRSATTLLGYLSVLRKHRQLIRNYPLLPPPESDIVGLLRTIQVGTSEVDGDHTDSPATVWIPSLCQVTLDLVRESGVLVTIDPEMLDSSDDIVKIVAFGERVESFPETQAGIMRYMPLASGSNVVQFEKLLGLALSSIGSRQLKLLGHYHDSSSALERQVDDCVREAVPAILARTSRTIASGDAWRVAHSVFTHHDNPAVRMTLTHTQPHEWQEMGITSETMKIHPIQLAIHQVDGVPLVSIMHTDVYRMRDVNAPETQAWAVIKVTVVHTVAVSAQCGPELAHIPFRLPQSITGDEDPEHATTPESTAIVSEGMQTPPLMLRHAVTDVRRHLDVDCLGKRAGEVTVKILSVVGLRAGGALKSVHAIVRLGRREVKGNNIVVSSVNGVEAWKESFTFVWDGVDILSLSLWGVVGSSLHEECVGHVQASLFQLVSGVPCRLRYDLHAADVELCHDTDVSYGEIELEVYYSHIRTLPLKKRPSRRRTLAVP